MSWIVKLYETYENCSSQVSKQISEMVTPLLPISHTTQNAQIQVTVDEDGNFFHGEVVDKDNTVTIIPCTEDSSSRSGKSPVCHPLCDKLQYLAGDYSKFGGEKGDNFYRDYITQLSEWCDSIYANRKVKLILKYLKKGTLIEDLVRAKILYCDEFGKLMDKWQGDKDNKPSIFKACPGNQRDAFVRFRIVIPGDMVPDLWKDRQVQDDYVQYYLHQLKEEDMCYATGKIIPTSEKHSSKIRNSADKAKLISSNDTSGFTFKGRFTDKSQVVAIGYDVSQKAHNALKWLIEKQGYYYDGKVILAWGTQNQTIPSIAGDSDELISGLNQEDEMGDLTDEGFASRLNQAIAGYKQDLNHSSEVVIIALDAATTGRLAITFYREMKGDQFLERIESWHKKCCWKHTYKIIGKEKKHITFIGAPAPKDIVLTAYGNKVNEKLKKAAIERLLPCIVDGAALPRDLVDSVVRRACNPTSMESWEWEKALSIACALYRKNYKKEELNMALDESITDRSYLFGRMLAVADQIENLAYDKWGERTTNAMRYMNVFSQKPFKTWLIIAKNLVPYQEKLGIKGKGYSDLLNEMGAKMDFDDYQSDKPLDGLFLLGYYCQKQDFREKAKAKTKNAISTEGILKAANDK